MADAKKSIIDTAAEIAEASLAQLESAAEVVKEKAGPMLAEAREKAAETLAEGRSLAADAAGQAADLAASGKEIATAKVAELKGEVAVEQSSGGRLKKVLLVGGLVALAAVIVRKLRSSGADDNWESSYTPAPAPSAGTAGGPLLDADDAVAADGGGASPDEALADAVEEPHEPTTPEEPAEVVDIDTARKSEEG